MAIAVTSAVSATGTLLGSTSRSVASSRNTTSLWATSLNRAFGLKTSHSRVTCLEKYKVTFIEGTNEVQVDVTEGDHLLEAAKSGKLMSKISKCEDGNCKKCTGQVIWHGGDEPYYSPLKLVEPPEGTILLCCNFPQSDTKVKIVPRPHK